MAEELLGAAGGRDGADRGEEYGEELGVREHVGPEGVETLAGTGFGWEGGWAGFTHARVKCSGGASEEPTRSRFPVEKGRGEGPGGRAWLAARPAGFASLFGCFGSASAGGRGGEAREGPRASPRSVIREERSYLPRKGRGWVDS